MADLDGIRTGIANNLGNVDLSPYTDPQVSPYGLTNPTLPSLMLIGLDEITYDRAMQRGLDEWTFILQGLVGLVSDIGAQKLLDQMLDSTGAASVKAAVETDRTLGGAVHDTRVVSTTGYRQYTMSLGEVLGCEWLIRVYA